jgi:hypothetical protein
MRMPKRDERLALPALGEYFDDLLEVDAWINGKTRTVQGQSLLCSKLQEREQRIKERVEYLAKKRGIPAEELWNQILAGRATRLSREELRYKPGDEG